MPTMMYQGIDESATDAEPAPPGRPTPGGRLAGWRLVLLLPGVLLVAALAAHPPLGAAAFRQLRPDGAVSYAAADAASEKATHPANETHHLRHHGVMDCEGKAWLKIKSMTHHNLGGKGPDEGGHDVTYKMLVQGGEHDGEEVQIRLTVTSPEGAFRPQKPSDLGMQGAYGSINLRAGSNVTISIQKVNPKTNATIPFDSFFFTFFDLDQGKDHEATESIIVHHFTEALIANKSLVNATKLDDGSLLLKAMTVGTGDDNPKDPNDLTRTQFRKAVTVLVKGQSNFEATFIVGPAKEDNPRWFNFRGQPSLLCAKMHGGKRPVLKVIKGDSGSVSSHLGGLVVVLLALLSGASLRQPVA